MAWKMPKNIVFAAYIGVILQSSLTTLTRQNREKNRYSCAKKCTKFRKFDDTLFFTSNLRMRCAI